MDIERKEVVQRGTENRTGGRFFDEHLGPKSSQETCK